MCQTRRCHFTPKQAVHAKNSTHALLFVFVFVSSLFMCACRRVCICRHTQCAAYKKLNRVTHSTSKSIVDLQFPQVIAKSIAYTILCVTRIFVLPRTCFWYRAQNNYLRPACHYDRPQHKMTDPELALPATLQRSKQEFRDVQTNGRA